MNFQRSISALLFLLALFGRAVASEVATNASELNRLLRGNKAATALQQLEFVQGCGPVGCGFFIGGLMIDVNSGSIQRANGRRLPWRSMEYKNYEADLPNVNWAPLRGYSIEQDGHPWGQCIEFGHSGLGNSGRGQRWRTIALVASAGKAAYRFTGYWATCGALTQGPSSSEISLPIVKFSKGVSGALQIVWNHCGLKQCRQTKDPRIALGSASAESGSLTIH